MVLSDTTSPVLQGPTIAVVVQEDDPSYTNPVVTAFDVIDGDLTAAIVTTGTVDITKPGVYDLVYSVSDRAGNTASLTVTVQVVVGGRPVIYLNGKRSMVWEAGVPFVDPFGTIIDSLQPDLNQHLISDAATAVNVNSLGTYTIAYTMAKADNQGFIAAPVARTVTVHDTVPPVSSRSSSPCAPAPEFSVAC